MKDNVQPLLCGTLCIGKGYNYYLGMMVGGDGTVACSCLLLAFNSTYCMLALDSRVSGNLYCTWV